MLPKIANIIIYRDELAQLIKISEFSAFIKEIYICIIK